MHQEALNDAGKTILPFFSKIDGFFPGGGTAGALQLGHRISVDFDFFSPIMIPRSLLSGLETIFKGKKMKVYVNNSNELTT